MSDSGKEAPVNESAVNESTVDDQAKQPSKWANFKQQQDEKHPEKSPVEKELQATVDEEGDEIASEEESEEGDVLASLSNNELRQRVVAAETKANENWNLALKAKADLENMRRRHHQKEQEIRNFANEQIIKSLLGVIDSLEQGIKHSYDNDQKDAVESLREGMELTLKMFLDSLKKMGVEQIDPVGKTFDPNFHEAISMETRDDVEPETVLTVMQKGYTLNQRLIRAALVVVAKAP